MIGQILGVILVVVGIGWVSFWVSAPLLPLEGDPTPSVVRVAVVLGLIAVAVGAWLIWWF